MNRYPIPTRLTRMDTEALVPLTRLAEEAARTASDARGLEEFVSDVVDRIPISERPDSNTLGGGRWVEILTPDAVYTSEARARMRQRERGLAAHVAIRVAAYMGWKAAEQASHVAQAAAGVVACASLARSVVAMRFRETPAQRRERALRRPLVEAWRRAAAPDEDRPRARAESDDDTDAENTADQPSPDVPRPDQDDEGPLVERNTLWRLFVEGCDWWSARTALAKARRRSRLATALARALMELRALYRPMEEVAVASWDARRMLHSRRHAADPLNERVAEHLAAAAGAAGGEVRRLLRVVQQMHATLLRAVQTLAADGHDLLDEHSLYPLREDSLNQRSLFYGLGLPLA